MIFATCMIVVGFVFGWCARSFQFANDQECANPEHADMTGPDMHPKDDES